MLGLDFIPLRRERYDLLITKERFFDPGVQLFLGLLPDEEFRQLADTLEGYDVSSSGKMVYPAWRSIADVLMARPIPAWHTDAVGKHNLVVDGSQQVAISSAVMVASP